MVPLEILDSVLLIVNAVLLIYVFRRLTPVPQVILAESQIVEKTVEESPGDKICLHPWGDLVIGGHEERAGKKRTIIKCNLCSASKVIEEE